MKTINKVTFILLSLLSLACDDIFEKDITNEITEITYPLSGTIVNGNTVDFQWNKLEGANKYKVQIFSMDQSLILEKVVEETKLSYTFIAGGQYQWRVRAENFAYQSLYSQKTSFSVLISNDLTTQQVALLSPQENRYTNSNNVFFNWQGISSATTYDIEVINTTNGQMAYNANNLTETSVNVNNTNFTQDAAYQWRVRAVNATSQTPFATRTFFIDTVNPNQPQNTTPANNSSHSVNNQVSFSWSIAPDSGSVQSPITYLFQIASDVDFGNLIQTSNVSSTSLQQSFSTAGTYFWRVKANDAAGNVSSASPAYKLTIN